MIHSMSVIGVLLLISGASGANALQRGNGSKSHHPVNASDSQYIDLPEYADQLGFHAKLGNASVLATIIEAIKDLVPSANVRINSDGIYLEALHSSHLTFVSLRLRSDLFEEYQWRRNMAIGFGTHTMAKALKFADSNDKCLIFSSDDQNSITLSFEGTRTDKTQQMTVKKMDIQTETFGTPDTTYEAVVTMPSNEFQKTCRDASAFSEYLNMDVKATGISFMGNSDNLTSVVRYAPTANVNGNNDETVTVDCSTSVTLSFDIRYLNHFTKASGLSSMVKLSLSNDQPLAVEYAIEGNGYLRYYLAAEIEDSAY